mgnify:CR=1 FL=1
MNLVPEKILEIVKDIDSTAIETIHRNQLSITVQKENIIQILDKLKNDSISMFDLLIDITAIDWLKQEKRFEVVYILYSNHYKTYLRIKTPIEEKDASTESVTSIYENADWYERETYDMYGIKFNNHPGLRRFYMPEDFKDPSTGEPLYPLRKDFPLQGVPDSLPLPPYTEKFGEIQS